MSELATAYVQLVPTATGMKGKIEKELGAEADAAGKSAGATAGNSLGASLGSTIKKVVIGLGIGKIIKDSISLGGELQQNLGGTEAVFGNFAKTIQTEASEAYRNMGMSASEYMATANKMGSLFQGSGLEQKRALELTTDAMQRAADVASVMGIDTSMAMESIAGAAKGNFTMMDNLGVAMNATTLQAYALEKGINFKWNTADNAQKAELAMQMFMERTAQYEGNFADESVRTFSGSLGAMQAAAQDFMANLALGQDITPALTNLQSAVLGFLNNNLFPMIGNVLQSAPLVIESIINLGNLILQTITNQAPEWVNAGINLISELVTGILNQIPYVIDSIMNLALAIADALINFDWVGTAQTFVTTLSENFQKAGGEILGKDGAGLIDALVNGIMNTIPNLLKQANVILKEFSGAVTSALPTIMQSGIGILTRLVDGILSRLPDIIRSAGEIINTMLDYIMKNLPTIMQGGMKILMSIVQGIAQNLPEIIKATMDVLLSLQQTIIEHLPEILEMGVKLVLEMVAGIIQATPDLVSAMLTLLEQGARQVTEIDWVDLGADIIKGIVRGIKSGGSAIWEAIKGYCEEAWSRTKAFFKIGSPSKLFEKEIGEMIPQGMAIGIEKDTGYVTRAMEDMAAETVNVSQNVPFYGKIQPQNSNTGALSIVNTFNINGANKDGKELAEEISYYLNADLQRTAGVWA